MSLSEFYSLKHGDTIGVAAPSARFDRNEFQKGVRCLESMGFQVHVPEKIFKESRYLAGTDYDRASVLNELFLNPEIKGIISVRGGFGAMRILELMDWESISDSRTLFIGFSDATAMISSLISKAGLIALHGPNLVSLSRAGQETLESFEKAIAGSQTKLDVNEGGLLKSGKADGRLVGGNLATLVHMVGTRFQPDFDQGILFIEDVGEFAYKIDRMLSQMKMVGMLNKVRGVVTGSFDNCSNAEYIPEIILDIFEGLDIPVYMGLGAGHGNINLSLPMGARVTLDAEKGTLTWEPLV